MNEIVSIATKFPDLLKEIYGDLAKPGVSQVGQAIGGIVGLGNTALLPVHLVNEKAKLYLEKNLNSYREQMEAVGQDKVIEVAPEVGVPILEKLAYVSNEELSQMYINLLAKASTVDGVNHAHPGFVKVIDSLSPDEGAFLRNIRSHSSIPFIEIRLKSDKKNEWNTLADMVLNSGVLSGLTYPSNAPSYVSNLDALGILKIRRDIWMIPENIHYDSIWMQNKERYLQLEGHFSDRSLTHQNCKIDKTAFGVQFIQACFTKMKK